jgi:hypothetical protein
MARRVASGPMPPTARFVCSFAAEPPQEPAPYGRWADTLREHFLAAALPAAEGEDIGEAGDVEFFPDRSWNGRTFVPATTLTTNGWEIFGYVSFVPAGEDGEEPSAFHAVADITDETAERNPDWALDLNDEVVGTWRGEQGKQAQMTLVWGRPLTPGGGIVTAELADLAVDQCELTENRFTLLAPDDYRGDFIDVKLWSARGELVASESLYVDDEG